MPTQFDFDPQKLLDDMVTFVAVLSPSGRIIFVNNTPLIAAGITLEAIQGTKFWDAAWWSYSSEAVARIREDCEYCATGKSLLHEIQLATADGTLIWIEYSMHPILDEKGNVEFLVPEGRDITDKKLQQMQLQHLAHYDTLTGLPNRVLFADRFKQAISFSKRTDSLLAVCFLDLDNFKPINDKYGHEIGDLLLVEVSHRLSKNIRELDTASRLGGDEFTILIGGFNVASECEELINRILESLAEPYLIGNKKIHITASCGITIFPDDNSDIDLLVRHADQAMYQSKLTGKNGFTFFDQHTERASKHQNSIQNRIIQALKDNELELFYQPKVDMREQRMFGCEALIRWHDPKRGLLAPIEFLPYIENSEIMIDLGLWVIEQALNQLKSWIDQGKKWCISINIDAFHLMHDDFFDTLRNLLEKYPCVDSRLLEIEILETVAFTDLGKVAKLLTRCRSLGIRFSLDDFGTGYASLTYLKMLPVQWLKIDRTFVRDMLVDEQDLALVEGVISLAKAFKRDVIAEGVENAEHAEALLKLGCHYGQGYFIAKPMPASEIIAWEASYS